MQSKILGTWVLESFTIETAQKETKSWGQNCHGLLIYSPDGYMSVSINKDVERKSDVDAQNIYDSILFYSGTFIVEGDTIQHQVTQASNPARIGREMLRFVTFESNILVLTTPQESFGRAILKWKKTT